MNKKNEYINKTLSRRQQEGFTLIELLAVITIMGILLLVAIPSISRTIENSRRDTFKSTAGNYVTAISNLVAADGLEDTDGTPLASAGDGLYYYSFDSSNDSGKDIMESGGKSSWGNKDLKGYVIIRKTTSSGARETVNYTYFINVCDTAGHGIKDTTPFEGMGRSDIVTKGCNLPENPSKPQGSDTDATLTQLSLVD